jgi:hypothetical protein
MRKIILITADSMAGLIFTNILLHSGVKPEKIYLADSVRGPFFAKLKKAFWLLARKSRIFLAYKFLAENIAFKHWILPGSALLNFNRIRAEFGCEVETVRDVNSADFKARFRTVSGSSLAISAYGSQIFDAELVDSASCFWNVHGSYLPYFKGAAPYFWMLFKEDSPRGVTVHKVSGKLDSGEIIERKEVLPGPEDTVFTYHVRCIIEAARTAGRLITEGPGPAANEPARQSGSSFGGIPAPKDLKALNKAGKRLFKFSDIAEVRRLIVDTLPISGK